MSAGNWAAVSQHCYFVLAKKRAAIMATLFLIF
jgi:hypothetical protein